MHGAWHHCLFCLGVNAGDAYNQEHGIRPCLFNPLAAKPLCRRLGRHGIIASLQPPLQVVSSQRQLNSTVHYLETMFGHKHCLSHLLGPLYLYQPMGIGSPGCGPVWMIEEIKHVDEP